MTDEPQKTPNTSKTGAPSASTRTPSTARRESRESKAFCRDCQKIAVLDLVQDGILIATLEYEILWSNEAFRSFMNVSTPTFDLQDIFPGSPDAPAPWVAEIAKGGRWRGDVSVVLNGKVTETTVEVAANGSRVIFVVTDPRQMNAIEKRLRHEVLRDDLTGLPNRPMFHEKLSYSMLEANENGTCASIMFIDLDRFKVINDSLGHDIGDHLLKAVATRIDQALYSNCSLYRMGGDEFVVVVDNATREQVHSIGADIIRVLSNPFSINGYDLLISCSIGSCFYPEHGYDISALLRHSDTALYEAKRTGRNRMCFYDTDMSASAVLNFEIENGLRHALARNEFSLAWQLQVDLGTGSICGVEALIRWHNLQMGKVSPDKFIPIAEEMHIISGITDWVLESACGQIRRWQQSGFHVPRVAINLSCVQLSDASLPARLGEIVRRNGISPGIIEIELTESAVMQDYDRSVAIVQGMKQIGFLVAIDDFGTGHSNLGYLKSLPVDKIKIDRSFVIGVPGDKNDVALTRAIIQMARSLGKDILAEGVETIEQMNFLWDNHCHKIQGYLFAKPVSGDEVPAIARVAEDKAKTSISQ